MKKSGNNIITYDEDGNEEYNVSTRPLKEGKIVLGIDMGCDGMFATLTSKDIDLLISNLKQAKKISMQS